MPRFDLNGDPIPDDQGAAPGGGPAGLPPIPPLPGQQGGLPPIPPLPPQHGGHAPPPPQPQRGGYSTPPPLPRHIPEMPSTYGAPPPYMGPPVTPPMPSRQPYVSPQQLQREHAIKWIAGGAALFVALTIAILFGHPTPVPAPSSYVTYTAPNGTYTVSRPADWKVETTSNGSGTFAQMVDPTDSSGVIFSNRSARIMILQGRIDSISGSVTDAVPAQRILNMQKNDLLTSHFSHVTDDKDYAFSTEGFGDGASITWSASGLHTFLPAPLKGYYVAMSGGNYYVTIVCQCREADWPNLKGPFQKVVGSLTELAPANYTAPVQGGEAYPSGPPAHRKPINTTPGL